MCSTEGSPSQPALTERKALMLAGFVRRLREALQLRGLSQADLARRIGVGEATVSEWLTRGRAPLGDVMLLLPEVLDVNGHWLLTGNGPREIPDGEHPDLYRQGAQDVLADVMRLCEDLRNRHGVPSE